MLVKEIQAKSLLRKYKKIDSWFISRYGMSLYRGCSHNCSYCDGRAERYRVDDDFGQTVTVKINAIDLLRRTFVPPRAQPPLRSGFIMLGGGVGDSYQPVEEQYQLTRKTLQLLSTVRYPVHILTKSTLALRDMDLIKQINRQTRAVVSMSISSVDNAISKVFEPGVPPPSERLRMLARFKKEGISCGVFLLPAIPFVTDAEEHLTAVFKRVQQIGVDFLIVGGMTLKPGRQQTHYYQLLKQHYPRFLEQYKKIYPGDPWGTAHPSYYERLHRTLASVHAQHRIPLRMPPAIYGDIVSDLDRVIIILEHLDYLNRLTGTKSYYCKVAFQLSKIKQPLLSQQMLEEYLRKFDRNTQDLIAEILRTKTTQHYEHLLQ